MPSFDPHDTYTSETIEEAREWLQECDWGEDDADEMIRDASPTIIMLAVERHYDGGIDAFVSAAA